MLTGLPSRLLSIWGSIPDSGKMLLSFPKRPEVLSEPPGFFFFSVSTSYSSPEVKQPATEGLLSRLRMYGAAPTVFPHAVIPWCIIKKEIKLGLPCIHIVFMVTGINGWNMLKEWKEVSEVQEA